MLLHNNLPPAFLFSKLYSNNIFRQLPIENLTYEEFLEIYGILDTNRTTIYSGELLNTTAVGIGIYLVSTVSISILNTLLNT